TLTASTSRWFWSASCFIRLLKSSCCVCSCWISCRSSCASVCGSADSGMVVSMTSPSLPVFTRCQTFCAPLTTFGAYSIMSPHGNTLRAVSQSAIECLPVWRRSALGLSRHHRCGRCGQRRNDLRFAGRLRLPFLIENLVHVRRTVDVLQGDIGDLATGELHQCTQGFDALVQAVDHETFVLADLVSGLIEATNLLDLELAEHGAHFGNAAPLGQVAGEQARQRPPHDHF